MTEIFVRCAAAGLVSVILILTLRGKNSEFALVVSLACCCMIALSAVNILKPVLDFLDRLRSLGNLDHQMVDILLKIVGIGFLGELSVTVCADSGNSAIGKMLQVLASAVIVYLALPLFSALLELVERIMGSI